MAVLLLTVSAPKGVANPEDPDSVLEEVKPNVPAPVIALVSRSKVQDPPDEVAKVATSWVDPTEIDDMKAPVPGPDETVTWLSVTLEQLDGMPVHVRLKTVREESEFAATEKSYMAPALAEAAKKSKAQRTPKHFFI